MNDSGESRKSNEDDSHRVHLVRVVYQNPAPRNNLSSGKDKEAPPKKQHQELWHVEGENCNGCKLEMTNDNWSCTTCTVIPCRCNLNGSSKCSSCDDFIEGQQQQEPGPVHLEYSCRCQSTDFTVVKTVCAKCATKIHDLLADILVCERQDHCVNKQLSLTSSVGRETGADLCSNCQVVGSRILNGCKTADALSRDDSPPPLPKRKFITRGAMRTPPPPRKEHSNIPPSPTPPPRRRLQRARSSDSPSDSDSSLSDNADYHRNLQYKPVVVPNDYIESDDFPTAATQNVSLDLSSLRLHDPLRNQYSNVDEVKIPVSAPPDGTTTVTRESAVVSAHVTTPQHAQRPSYPAVTSAAGDVISHNLTILPMHGSSSPSLADSSIVNSSSGQTLYADVVAVSCPQQVNVAPSPDVASKRTPLAEAKENEERNYETKSVHELSDDDVTTYPVIAVVNGDCQTNQSGDAASLRFEDTIECDIEKLNAITQDDLIDLRSPTAFCVAESVPVPNDKCTCQDNSSVSSGLLWEPPNTSPDAVFCEDFASSDHELPRRASSPGAHSSRRTLTSSVSPSKLDLVFMDACYDENGVPDLNRTVKNLDEWPSLADFQTDITFGEVPTRREKLASSLSTQSESDTVFADEQTVKYSDTRRESYDARCSQLESESAHDSRRQAIGRYGPEMMYDSVNDLETHEKLSEEELYARTHRRTGSAGGRVEQVDAPPPKLPLKSSLSYNQSPPPIPARDFRAANRNERQIMTRPHRISRPQTFEPVTARENEVIERADSDNNLYRMPDLETNRTVTQLVFGSEFDHHLVDVKPQEKPAEVFSLSTLPSVPVQRKKRPLICLLKPKQTLNKIFHKKSKEAREKSSLLVQRQLPPIPVDSRNYCIAEPIGLPSDTCPHIDTHQASFLSADLPQLMRELPRLTADLAQGGGGDMAPQMRGDLPPPLMPREPLHSGDQHSHHHNFIDSLIKLREVGWYWGPLSMDKAESKLADKKDGSFLVRDSSHDSYILSLSFRSQSRTHHTRIEFFQGTFGFWSQPSSHGRMSIVEFIEKAMEHSRNGKFLYFLRPHSPGQAPSPVVLLYPISRYERLQSLQHACRFVILKYVRYDHIDQLPLPKAIKKYLMDKHYFSENNDKEENNDSPSDSYPP